MKKTEPNAGDIFVNVKSLLSVKDVMCVLSTMPTIDMLNEIKRRTDTKKLICVIETDIDKEVIKYERSKETAI